MSKQKPRARKEPTDKGRLPKGWDGRRVAALADYYDRQSDDDAIAEAQAAYNSAKTAMIQVPIDLVPKVEKLIRKRAG
ncbi:MAG TPA: hypothetical protein VHY37_14475 [Tepidisphaeraceae bacterium]|jgi:hypothetical protein|nr:hypothetical protein [Tepidisphaeraceae bacterium]